MSHPLLSQRETCGVVRRVEGFFAPLPEKCHTAAVFRLLDRLGKATRAVAKQGGTAPQEAGIAQACRRAAAFFGKTFFSKQSHRASSSARPTPSRAALYAFVALLAVLLNLKATGVGGTWGGR